MGILFAFLAAISWGVGDFLVQKSSRRFGDGPALLFVSGFAALVLLPLVFKDIPTIFSGGLIWLFLLASFLVFVSSLFDYEGLRQGKVSVIEPVFSFEIVIAGVLSWILIGETLNIWQIILIFVLTFGLFFVSIKSFSHLKSIHTERGVWYAVLATIGVACVSLTFAMAARETDPLLINWFSATAVFIFMLFYLLWHRRFGEAISMWQKNKVLAFSVGFFTNFAWIAYATAALYLPVAIVTGISEGYIALAVLLGLIFNKEKLKLHQKIGLIITLSTGICLAFISNF